MLLRVQTLFVYKRLLEKKHISKIYYYSTINKLWKILFFVRYDKVIIKSQLKKHKAVLTKEVYYKIKLEKNYCLSLLLFI